jgi:hypothetical protein
VEKPYERKPRYDETEVDREKVGTEKVTITRTYEDGRVDRMERQKYPNDKDVGRIVMDETVEKTPKEVRHKITDRPRKKETTTTRNDVIDIHRTDVKDVQRTYIHKEKEHFGPTRPEEQFLPETERLDHQRKVSRRGFQEKKYRYFCHYVCHLFCLPWRFYCFQKSVFLRGLTISISIAQIYMWI